MPADSDGLLETLFETIPVALALLDRDLRLQRANAAFAALWGQDSAVLAGRTLDEVAPALAALLAAPLRRARDGGAIVETIDVEGAAAGIAPAEGVWRGTIYPLAQAGSVSGLTLVLTDVTDQRRAEERLRQSEERFRSLVQNGTDIVVVLDVAGRVQYVSPSARRVLGYDPEAVIGVNVFSLIHPDDVDRLQAIFAGVVSRPGPFNTIEFRVRHADGGWRYVETTATNALNDPAVRGIVQNVRDVSERKRIEAERDAQLAAAQEARAAAEAANRAKDVFLSVVSHELRAPLTPILAYAHMLRTRPLGEAQRTAALEQIERSARTQARLVEDILDATRIATGKLTLERVRVDLAAVAAAALETVRPEAEAKQIALSAELGGGGAVIGDAGRLQQVLWNLLSNAVKFTPVGGRVALTLARSADRAVITVVDTGAGIAPDFLPHVFERFQQAEISHGQQRGLGLGLAVAREIVELHGGTITAASEGEGLGATFTVSLPLAPVEDDQPARVGPTDELPAVAPPASPATLAGVRALLVEDDAADRELLRLLLEGEGATVQTSGSAAEARAAFTAVPPDVLISDIALPDEDGYALLESLRELAAPRRRLPAIAVTAYAANADVARARAAGYTLHLGKPVDGEALIDAVAALLGRNVGGQAG